MNWATLPQKLWQKLGNARSLWMIAPTAAGLVLLVRGAGWLQPLEWAALDLAFQLRPPEPPVSEVVIIGIEESDLRQVGQWPIPDQVLATALAKLKQPQPIALGLDLYRDLPVQPGHDQLVRVFETTPNLIGIEKKVGERSQAGIAQSTGAIAPPPALKARDQVGSNDIVIDADGKLRRGMLFLTLPSGEVSVNFGVRLAMMYLAAQGITPPRSGNFRLGSAEFVPFEANDGGYVRADAAGYQFLINFRPAASFKKFSLSDVLGDRIPPKQLRGKIVLIGPTADSLNDFFYYPYSNGITRATERIAGVEVQANIISHLIDAATKNRPQIKTWNDPLEWTWTIAWACAGAVLSWRFPRPRWILLGNGSLAVGLMGSAYLSFLGGWWIPVVPPLLTLTLSAVATTGYIANREREERQTVMNLFGRHVTPEIAEAIWRDRDQLLQDGRLRGQQMTATVLFTDIKDFSSIAEAYHPETLMSWLNEYMEAMAQIVLAHGGVIDKYIGDSVMAVFGVPIPHTTPEAIATDAQQAVRCALAMAQALETLNQHWKANDRPPIAMRVGISTGPVVVGSLGSAQRLDYTTLGDSVNIASRLESYDKSVGISPCRILINEETHRHCQHLFPTQFIGSVNLRGKKQAVEIYQVLLQETLASPE